MFPSRERNGSSVHYSVRLHSRRRGCTSPRFRVRALIQIARPDQRPDRFFIFDTASGLLISVNGGSQSRWVYLPGEYITPIGVIPADRSSVRSIVVASACAAPASLVVRSEENCSTLREIARKLKSKALRG